MGSELPRDDDTLQFAAVDEAATDRLGKVLANIIPSGTVVALSGTLGAGKTRLVQAVAAGCDIADGEVLSPTYVIAQHYQGKRLLHHFDVYRVRDEDEFLELGPEEAFESAGITFIEWGERFAGLLPEDRLEITIQVTGPTSRGFTIRGTGDVSQALVQKLKAELAGANQGGMF